MIFRNAEDGVPYDGIALILGVFKRANTVRPYRVADDLCGFFEKTAIICLGSFGKGAARRAEDW